MAQQPTYITQENSLDEIEEYAEFPAIPAWTVDEDQKVWELRANNMLWQSIASHVKGRTPNACRKRHEELAEKRRAEAFHFTPVLPGTLRSSSFLDILNLPPYTYSDSEVRWTAVDLESQNNMLAEQSVLQGQKQRENGLSTVRDHSLYHSDVNAMDGLYYCPYRADGCRHKPDKLKYNYDKHLDSHLKPYRCEFPACQSVSFPSTACLLRHEREAHAMHKHGNDPFRCPYPECDRGVRGFPRRYKLEDHMRRMHDHAPPTRHGLRPKSKTYPNTVRLERSTSESPQIHAPLPLIKEPVVRMPTVDHALANVDLNHTTIPIAPASLFADSGYHTASWKTKSVTGMIAKEGKECSKSTSEYSSADSTITELRQGRSEEIAEILVKRIKQMPGHLQGISDKEVSSIVNAIRLFALRVGYDGSSPEHWRAMAFMHQHARKIATLIAKRINNETDNDLDEDSTNIIKVCKDGMSLHEKVENYLNSIVEPKSAHHSQANINVDIDDDEEEAIETPADAYRQLVVNSTAFVWLHDSIDNAFRLTSGNVTEELLKIIDPGPCRISRKARPNSHHLVINVKDWRLKAFVQDQAAKLRARGVERDSVISLDRIEHTISFTGSSTNAQALTCGEYLDQTWPLIGRIVLGQVKAAAAVRNERTAHQCDADTLEKLPGVRYFSANAGATFEVVGEIHAVAEICQIIAWITSALRASPYGPGICAIRPVFSRSSYEKSTAALWSETLHDRRSTTPVFLDIAFDTRKLSDGVPGTCWFKMFNNPVVVEGYPILRRGSQEEGTGLEISLAIISAILRTDRATIFNGALYIKAFSSMLVPTKHSNGTIVWHFLYDEAGDYLGYSKNENEAVVELTPEHVIQCRHIIGLCSNAKFNAGSPEANLFIERSGLDSPRQEFALKGFSISGGKFLTVGANVTIGHKDPSLRVVFLGSPIIHKLEWVSLRNFVLWDCDTDRGHLVDGLSALLYMLRVYLNERRNSLFADALLFEPTELAEPSEAYPYAAARFFSMENWKNMKLKLHIRSFESHQTKTSDHDKNKGGSENRSQMETIDHDIVSGGSEDNKQMRTGKPDKGKDKAEARSENSKDEDKTSFYLLQDRVQDLLEILFNTTDLQKRQAEREGIYYKGHFRKHLEGWDFKDLAVDHFHYEPVTKVFPCVSLPWIDFVRSIGAVTLFGRGFGEIIEAVDTKETGTGTCPQLRKVPEERNYLTAYGSTLQTIMKRHNGDHAATPKRLTSKFTWYSPMMEPTSCSCTQICPRSVEIIWPASLQWLHTEKQKQAPLNPQGAVIFGSHSRFQWFRCQRGNPFAGQAPDPDDHEGNPNNAAPPAPMEPISQADTNTDASNDIAMVFESTNSQSSKTSDSQEPPKSFFSKLSLAKRRIGDRIDGYELEARKRRAK